MNLFTPTHDCGKDINNYNCSSAAANDSRKTKMTLIQRILASSLAIRMRKAPQRGLWPSLATTYGSPELGFCE